MSRGKSQHFLYSKYQNDYQSAKKVHLKDCLFRAWWLGLEKLQVPPVTNRLISLAVFQPVRDRKEWRREEKLRAVPLSFSEIRQRGSNPHPHPQCVRALLTTKKGPVFAVDPSRWSLRIAQDDASFSREAHGVTEHSANPPQHEAPLGSFRFMFYFTDNYR